MQGNRLTRVVGGLTAGGLVCLLAAGCGEAGARNLKLDPDVARQSLTAFLDGWQKGEPSTAMKERDPPITFGDPFRDTSKLVRYRVIDAEKSDGANMHAVVELNLQDKSGKIKQQQVTYIVGTSPVITVFSE